MTSRRSLAFLTWGTFLTFALAIRGRAFAIRGRALATSLKYVKVALRVALREAVLLLPGIGGRLGDEDEEGEGEGEEGALSSRVSKLTINDIIVLKVHRHSDELWPPALQEIAE